MSLNDIDAINLGKKRKFVLNDNGKAALLISGCTGMVVLFVVTLIVTSILNGFVLVQLWSWFVMPIFELKALTIPLAIGFSMVVSYLTYTPDFTQEDKRGTSEKLVTALVYPFLRAAMVLLGGAIVHAFV